MIWILRMKVLFLSEHRHPKKGKPKISKLDINSLNQHVTGPKQLRYNTDNNNCGYGHVSGNV